MTKTNFIKISLLGLVGLYALTNLTLFIASIHAWKQAKAAAGLRACSIGGLQCGFTLWGIYPLQATAAFVAFVTALTMAISCFSRTKGSSIDPLYVFRGIFFSLLALAPILFIGWSNLNYTSADFYNGFIDDRYHWDYQSIQSETTFDEQDAVPRRYGILNSSFPLPQFTGIGGAFVLQTMAEVPGAGLAIVLVHFNM